MQLSKRNVTQWPHWHPTGQCLGSINACSAHVIPPHGVPHHPMRNHFLPSKFISALCHLHPSWAVNHFPMQPTICCSPRDPASSKGDPRDSHRPQQLLQTFPEPFPYLPVPPAQPPSPAEPSLSHSVGQCELPSGTSQQKTFLGGQVGTIKLGMLGEVFPSPAPLLPIPAAASFSPARHKGP